MLSECGHRHSPLISHNGCVGRGPSALPCKAAHNAVTWH